MKTELERHKAALKRAKQFIDYATGSHRYADICLEEINTILNPPPEVEEVEVVRWVDLNTGDVRNAEVHVIPDHYIKLTGTYKRPKPQPVERSVEFPVEWERCEGIVFPCAALGSDADIHALEGKTGTLTFTWTEPTE